MELPPRGASFAPTIKCSSCDADIQMHLMADHSCQSVTSRPFVEEPEQTHLFPSIPTQTTQPPTSNRPPRPFVPRIDPFAPSRPGIHGELTPASSGPGSAAASPISPGMRLPFSQPPRKSSASIRRPPSPELISQDCAFPPFPTSKTKKKETSRPTRERTRTPEVGISRSQTYDPTRSASVGASKSRLRQGTGDSSRPSTASSSRRPSLASKSESRQASIDVPPLPQLQPSVSHPSSDPGSESRSLSPSPSNTWPLPQPSPAESLVPRQNSLRPDIQDPNNHQTSTEEVLPTAEANIDTATMSAEPQFREPSYRAKRPPRIENMPPPALDDSLIPKSMPSPSGQPPPPTPSTLARTLTSIFGRKRGQSTSSKRSNPKTPATDGPRFVALSPEPDPKEPPLPDFPLHTSQNMSTVPSPTHYALEDAPPSSAHNGQDIPPHTTTPSDHSSTFEEAPPSAFATQAVPEVREPGPVENHHDMQRDTLQMEQDLERRLAAMTAAPRLAAVEENSDELKRASADSASSYGSVEFSQGSTSSRSFRAFDGHSQVSSVSTARTTTSSEDALGPPMIKIKQPDTVPDSPTDPYLQFGRLTPVQESLAPQDSTKSEVEAYLEHGRLSTVPEVASPEEEKSELLAGLVRSDSRSPLSDISRTESPQLAMNPVPLPPAPATESDGQDYPMSSRQRRPSTPGAVRGTCRGCSKRILSGQKSVSSKDGRLTGKYHKECFVCMECKEPFATADFYVHNDHPYCAHHYHELNETLCEGCGQGIEGHYFETSNISGQGAKKFHSQCLKCATCRIQLNEDYFELGGKVYCERDAFKVASGPRSPYGNAPSRPSPLNREYISSGVPGHGLAAGRFPERRLTKLMTTY